jgi:hypothetical protein
MTKEEAVEILLAQPQYVLCPRLAEVRLVGESVCEVCEGWLDHGKVPNHVYAAACTVLGIEAPAGRREKHEHEATLRSIAVDMGVTPGFLVFLDGVIREAPDGRKP